ncbi:MAG: hypothetical protein ACOY37_07210 [Pseudomonadota bacterium]
MKTAVAIGRAVAILASSRGPAAYASDDLSSALIRDTLASREVARRLAPTRSLGDLRAHLAPSSPQLSPLKVLPAPDRQRFLRSLKFNDKGLVEFEYSALAGLNADDVYRILGLFGLQSGTGKMMGNGHVGAMDYWDSDGRQDDFLKDYRCQARATCSYSISMACTANC